jgi:hypothetical protein
MFGGIELDEVASVGNEMQLRVGNLFCQAVGTVDWDPGVLGAHAISTGTLIAGYRGSISSV